EDGIRDDLVTGVQTCALPIWNNIADQADCLGAVGLEEAACEQQLGGDGKTNQPRQEITRAHVAAADADADIGGIHPRLRRSKTRSEERRVGKWRKSRWVQE